MSTTIALWAEQGQREFRSPAGSTITAVAVNGTPAAYTGAADRISLTTPATVGSLVTLTYLERFLQLPQQGPRGDTGPPAWAAVTPWSPGVPYTVSPPASVVTYLGETFVCAAAHTAGLTFDAAKWTLVAAHGDGADDGFWDIPGSGHSSQPGSGSTSEDDGLF